MPKAHFVLPLAHTVNMKPFAWMLTFINGWIAEVIWNEEKLEEDAKVVDENDDDINTMNALDNYK